MVLGDNPTGIGVVEAEVGQPAQVECGGSVVEPVVVLDDTSIAQPAVAANEPGDGPFDHGPRVLVAARSGPSTEILKFYE